MKKKGLAAGLFVLMLAAGLLMSCGGDDLPKGLQGTWQAKDTSETFIYVFSGTEYSYTYTDSEDSSYDSIEMYVKVPLHGKWIQEKLDEGCRAFLYKSLDIT